MKDEVFGKIFLMKNGSKSKRKTLRNLGKRKRRKVSSTNFNPFPEIRVTSREIKCFFRELSDEILFLTPRKVKWVDSELAKNLIGSSQRLVVTTRTFEIAESTRKTLGLRHL